MMVRVSEPRLVRLSDGLAAPPPEDASGEPLPAPRPSGRISRSISRGLVIQTAFHGDVILTTPLIRRAAERLGAPVDVVTIPAAAPVLANNPSIREVIAFDKNGKDQGIGGFVRMVRKLRVRQYSVAYLAQASPRSALLAVLAKIPRRIGFRGAKGRWFYTHEVGTHGEPHQVERLLALADGAPERREPEIFPSAGEREAVDQLLAEAGITGQ
ncbi:MAG: glycosyltransferase family 9 protein, partial [Gemmatimonadota bacterium]